jgi:hypothetical protein
MTQRFRSPTLILEWMSTARCHPSLWTQTQEGSSMDGLLQIVIIVVIVLFILGYFGRGRFRS